MPHATIIMEVQVGSLRQAQGRRLRVKRELEGGWFQWMTLPLPAVLTIQSGINQLRYATLKGIMAAKKKEIRKVTPAAGAEATAAHPARLLPGEGEEDADDRRLGCRRRQRSGHAAARRREGHLVMILVIAEQRDGKLNRASWETIAAAQQAGVPVKIVVPGSKVACRGRRGRGGRRGGSDRVEQPRAGPVHGRRVRASALPRSSRPSSPRWCFCRTPTRPVTSRRAWRRGSDARS